jgi:hypothetical protein
MIVPPFMVDARARPDRALADQIAAAHGRAEGGAGVLLDHDVPDIMFSPQDQPTRPLMRTFGPSIRPTPK